MPRPIELRRVLRVLAEHGFELVSQKGSHAKLRHAGKTVIVKTTKKEIPYGTFRSILDQSGLQEERFRSSRP